jgi:hypothetical protein
MSDDVPDDLARIVVRPTPRRAADATASEQTTATAAEIGPQSSQ